MKKVIIKRGRVTEGVHAKAMEMIGEISGVTLQIDGKGWATVTISIDGNDCELIRDFYGGEGCIVDRHITRLGIMDYVLGEE